MTDQLKNCNGVSYKGFRFFIQGLQHLTTLTLKINYNYKTQTVQLP